MFTQQAFCLWGHVEERTKMTKWTMRILGGLNVLFGLDGIWYFITRLTWHFQKTSVVYSARDWTIFSLLSFCTLSMVSSLVYLGIRLIIGNKTCLPITTFIFAAEILYFFADAVNVVPFNPSLATHIPLSFWGVAAGPIAPQIVTAYPLLGIIICIFLLRGNRGSLHGTFPLPQARRKRRYAP